MANRKNPTIKEWQTLYAAADRFKNAGCWEWVSEDYLFGVQDPESGEIAFCCIMGVGGEHLALAAYLGPSGLNSLYQLADEDNMTDDFDKMFGQKCLMGSFEDRDILAPEDLKIIKELNLKYRGRNQWPFFRSYEPGYFPLFLTAAQCRFLTCIFEQALEVCLRLRNDPEILGDPFQYHFLIRKPAATVQSAWMDEYRTIEPEPVNFVSIQIVDELMLRKLRSLKVQPGLVWETDIFYLQSPVKEKGRPFFPLIALLLDHNQQLIINHEMFQDLRTEGYKCLNMLVNYIQSIGKLPAGILVSQERSYHLFKSFCDQLHIKLEQHDELPLMLEIRQGISELYDK